MRLACLLVLVAGCGDNGASAPEPDAVPPCTPGLHELVTPDPQAAEGIAAGFLDLGRNTDLVLARGNDVGVLLGQGHHVFAPAMSFVGSGARAVALADLDGDHELDVIASALGGIDIGRGNGSGSFAAVQLASAAAEPTSIATADVNLDGDLDLITSSQTGGLSLYLGTGNATVGPEQPIGIGTTPGPVAIADVDADDYPDIVVTESGGSPAVVSVLWGGPDATFSAPQDIALSGTSLPFGAAVGDVTGDGHLDLVVADAGADQVDVFPGDGHRHFAAPIALPSHMPMTVAIGDVDNDHVPDIVVGAMATLDAFHGDGKGGFGAREHLATMDVAPRTLLLADIDDDRLLDVVMANVIGAPQVVYGACVR